MAVSSEDTLRDALAAQELMTSPVANTRGDDVTPDYSKGIAHVRLTLDELRERKQRTDELCDVRRIKLQQLLQLKQSERDAEQVKISFFRYGSVQVRIEIRISYWHPVAAPAILAAVQTKLSFGSGTIRVFFFAADKIKDDA